jgi:hypothetical protein
VKYGWHWLQTSTWIEGEVDRVSNWFPQAQTAVIFR